jgi:putative ABC transport system permease protein
MLARSQLRRSFTRSILGKRPGRRFNFLLIGLFAVVAAFLSVAGIYGVVSSAVHQRTAEIGLRIAFGAGPISAVRLMIGRGLILGAVGIGIDLLVSVGLTKFMASMLVGIHLVRQVFERNRLYQDFAC